ncbi:peroxide stress protein YaaA, partial [Microbacterium sp. zg.Y909]|nr:peroxide stress protein YaaA [Microbacterium sp. zg.Y909]
AAIAAADPAFVLDLRSEAYVALGPVPATVDSVYVRVVSAGPGGTVRALNHFNKRAKGELVRLLAAERPVITSLPTLRDWAESVGLQTRPGTPGEIELFASM